MSDDASMRPSAVPSAGPGLDRRALLRGLAGAAGLAAFAPVLAACGASTSPGGQASGPTSIGSNASDPKPKQAFTNVFAAFTKKTGIKVNVNTVDHNTYQEQINSYLQGNPQDDFMWFSGFRMRFFAGKGLASPIDDVWKSLQSDYSAAVQQASKGTDGHYYLVPFDYYPWALFYRKSVWQSKGYQVPKTLAELKSLCGKMQADGLVPIAFADKDGWPAMGTFDHLDLRTNGYQFHMELMDGKQSWTDPKVKQVFLTWQSLLPFMQLNSLGRTWQEAAQTLQAKKAGMYLIGSFVAQQFTGGDVADLDFFDFPEIDPQWGMDTCEAPLDGIMMSRAPKNKQAATKLLEYMGSADAQGIYLQTDSSILSPNKSTSQASYTALQKKAVAFITQHTHTTQFLDRDTRPDFASTVVLPSLQKFISSPNSLDSILQNMERQKTTIFAS